MKKIGVLGAGSWGTALTWLLTNNGHEVTLWSIMEAEVEMLRTKREHTSKLPGVKLQESIQLTSNLEEAMADKDVLVLAVPSPYTRSTAQKMAPYLKKGQIVVNVAKGVEEHTLMTLSQIIEEELPEANVAVLSGPSHAEEVGKGLPTTCVVGARTRQIAEYLQEIFMSPVFRVYTSPDVLGIELGAALKNVIALARGAYLKKDTMIHIGETYGKSPAQIGLRWLVQKGISAIPKSVNPERIAENADIFDFELTDMEMKTIDALDEKFRSAGIPEDMQGFVI